MRKWALLEQGFLSLANFGLAIFLTRELPKAEWGTYSLGFGLMLFVQGFQRALVCIPIATMTHQDDVLSQSLRFWRRIQTKVTVAALLILIMAAIAAHFAKATSSLSDSLFIAALLVPGFFAQEFWRRLLIQAHNIRAAAIIACFFFLSVALLLPLLYFNHTGALIAAAGLSLCALLAGIFTRYRVLQLIPAARGSVDFGDKIWQFGRWASLSHLAYAGYNTAIQVALSLIAGPAAMGSFSAVKNLTQPINTLIGAIDNIDKPRAARAFAAEGFPGLFSSLRRTISTLSIIGGVYLLMCAAGGGYLINVLYHQRYGYAWNELWLWCLIAAAMMAAQPLESGLYVANRTDALFANRVISSVIGLGAAVVCIPTLGVIGALIGLASGYLTTAVLAACQLYRISRQSPVVEEVPI